MLANNNDPMALRIFFNWFLMMGILGSSLATARADLQLTWGDEFDSNTME
jgi:hypothetical protein